MAMFLPIEKQPGLIADLKSDPFVRHVLSSATCELYHRYGMFLAPLTAALTALKHCQFGGDEAGEPRGGRWKELRRKLRIRGKWRPGRAGAAVRKAKEEERFLKWLRVGKEPLRSPAGHDTSANIPPKEVVAVSQPERHEGLTDWIPWVVVACLGLLWRVLVSLRSGQTILQSTQTIRHAPAALVDSAPKRPVSGARQLKTRDPFYME